MKVNLYMSRYGLPIVLIICVFAGTIGRAENTHLKVGISNNPPTVFLDEKGTPQGAYVDILNAIAEKENWTLDYVFGQWEEILDKVKAGDIDLLTAIAHSPERAVWFDFSREAFVERWGVVYAPKGATVRTMADLAGKRIALSKQDIHAGFFKQAADAMGLELTLLEVAGYEAAFEALKSHKADAGVVSNGYGQNNAGRYGLVATPLTFKPTRLVVAFPKGRHNVIAETIDVYLKQWKNEPGSVYLTSYQYWLGAPRGQDSLLSLTPEQRAWLAKHNTVRVAFDGHFPPYSYLNEEGQIEGLAVDVLRLLADRIGIRLDIHPTYVWRDLFEAAVRKEVDVVATMVQRPEREQWFVFTRPYVHKSLVIMTRSDDSAIQHREDIAGKRVALVRGYQYVPRIIQDFPTLKPTYVDTMLDGLNAVATHNADAAVTFFGAGRQLQLRYGIANLKFAAIYDRNSSLDSIAVRKDWPELAAILDKILIALRDTEIHALQRNWNTDEVLLSRLQSDRLSSRQKAWLVSLAMLLGLLLLSFMVVIAWNRTLRQKVGIKTQALEMELAERFKAEAQILRGRKEWEATFDAMSDWICLIDSNKRILLSNRAGKNFVGISTKDIIGQNCCELIHGIGKSIPDCPVDTMLESRQCETLEYYRSDNNKWINITADPVFDEDGNISRAVHVFQDISKQKEMEAKLIQAQKMESIGTLAGGIAHDFNNILYSITGYTELAMDDVPEGSLVQSNLKEVFKGAMRAKDMVKQILAFSRKAETEKKPIKVQSVVKEALKLLRTSIPTTIDIRQNIDTECGPVLADSTQIHQMVMNLATNAYQAMREKGGVLELTLMEDKISFDDSDLDLHPGTYLKFTVNDTGYGMDSVVIKKIFDPYFSTKGPGEGTGMGLAVVHGIVKDHGGDIEVYSKLGEGTTLTVYLPLVETRSFEPKTISVEPVPTGTERILFVDDEETIVLMTQQTLERLGYQVTPRTSSVEALEAFRAQPDNFDLVITDFTMPNMTGIELAPKLLDIRPDIPIIICTGFSEVIDKNRAKAIGIREYVMKPIAKEEIARTIRKVLDEGKEK